MLKVKKDVYAVIEYLPIKRGSHTFMASRILQLFSSYEPAAQKACDIRFDPKHRYRFYPDTEIGVECWEVNAE